MVLVQRGTPPPPHLVQPLLLHPPKAGPDLSTGKGQKGAMKIIKCLTVKLKPLGLVS